MEILTEDLHQTTDRLHSTQSIAKEQAHCMLAVLRVLEGKKKILEGDIWRGDRGIWKTKNVGEEFGMSFDSMGVTFHGKGSGLGKIKWQELGKKLMSPEGIRLSPDEALERASIMGALISVRMKLLEKGENKEIHEVEFNGKERDEQTGIPNDTIQNHTEKWKQKLGNIIDKYDDVLDIFCHPEYLKHAHEDTIKNSIEKTKKIHQEISEEISLLCEQNKVEIITYLESMKDSSIEKSGEQIWCLNACIAIHRKGDDWSIHAMNEGDIDKTLWGIYDGTNTPEFLSWENAKEIGKNITPISAEWEDIKNIRKALGRNHTMEAVGHGAWLIIDTVSDVATAIVTVGSGGVGLPLAVAARMGGKALVRGLIKKLIKTGVRAKTIRKTLTAAKTTEGITKILQKRLGGYRHKPFHLEKDALTNSLVDLPRSKIIYF